MSKKVAATQPKGQMRIMTYNNPNDLTFVFPNNSFFSEEELKEFLQENAIPGNTYQAVIIVGPKLQCKEVMTKTLEELKED